MGISLISMSSKTRGSDYLILRLVGRHVVLIWAHLPEQSLLHQSNVLSISSVVPIVDQTSPHSAGFPPVIRLPKEAKGLSWVCAMIIAEHILGDGAGDILD